MQTQTKRNEIAKEYTWNLESIFPNDEDWRRDYAEITRQIAGLTELKGKLSESGKMLFDILQARDTVFEKLEKLYVYTSMRKDEDTTNSTYQGMYDQAMQLYVQATTAIAFIDPEIMALPQEKQDQFVQDYPELKLYDHQLHDLSRNRPHIRSAEVEAILAAAGEITEAPDTIVSMIDNADLQLPAITDAQGNRVELTKGNYLVYIRDTDRRAEMVVRSACWSRRRSRHRMCEGAAWTVLSHRRRKPCTAAARPP